MADKKNQMKNLKIILVSGISLTMLACAGPTTPFGAHNTLSPQTKENKATYDHPTAVDIVKNEPRVQEPEESMVQDLTKIEEEMPSREVASQPMIQIKPEVEDPHISFFPRRQVLHRRSDWQVQLDGTFSPNPQDKIAVRYNGVDVTKKFLDRAYLVQDGDQLNLVFKNLRLPYNRRNTIEVRYKQENGQTKQAFYNAPTCSIYDQAEIKNTDRFKVPANILKYITRYTREYHYNPNLLSGVVAQESAFNPKAVSWAKAIGLTQVTPLAENEIIDSYNHFPRYPSLNRYPSSTIKQLIKKGAVTSKNEWRLNPKYSIQGGAAYLSYVDRYWRMKRNAKVLKSLRGDPYIVYSQVMLASYNSGPSRVKNAIRRLKNSWLLDSQLKEAHKYVNRVFSFCYHFSEDVASLNVNDKNEGSI